LVELGNSFDAGESPELRVLAYLGAAMHAVPAEAFCAQLVAMQRLCLWFPPGSAVHRLVLLPYVEGFWRRVVEQSRFYFSAPGLVAGAIGPALAAPEAERLKAILRAVRLGFFNLAPSLQTALAWLSAKP
jgi:hypothetical protein